jgi:hypothetical protein
LGKVQSSLKVRTTLNTSSQKGEEEKGPMLNVIQLLLPNKWDTTTSAIGNSSAKKNKTSIHV